MKEKMIKKEEFILNYEQTIYRIVEENLRFSESSMKGLYTFYRDYILNKKRRTDIDEKYLQIYPSIMQSYSRRKKEVN